MSYTEVRDARELKFDPRIAQPCDPVYRVLLAAAFDGLLPISFASIPFHLIRPISYLAVNDARRHPVMPQMLKECKEGWESGEVDRILVYEDGPIFIAPDDPCLYAIYTDYSDIHSYGVPCMVIGKITNQKAVNIRRCECDPKMIILGTREPGKINCRIFNAHNG
jgi:hypothetical protein